MMQSSILIIYTGGTIGMMATSAGLIPSWQFSEQLSDLVGDRFPGLRFTIRCLDPLIDSAEADPGLWYVIAHEVLLGHADFDGVVILHGTDTLAYTASSLSFLLNGLAKPIILTGAQIPFCGIGSDAESNIFGAVSFASAPQVHEVCIFFDGKLLRGNRSIKSSTSIGDSFESPHYATLGSFVPAFRINEGALLKPAYSEPELPPACLTTESIGLLKVYPGISHQMLIAGAETHPRGLVLELYGSGTAPILNSSIRQALEFLAVRKIPVVGVSQCLRGVVSQASSYASSYVLRDAGVIAGHDLTPAAAMTKLSYLQTTGTPFETLERAMWSDISGEITVDPEKRT
jgi:L-asparaginase